MNTLVPGEAIGEMSLLTQSPASASVRARDDVELLVLDGHDLERLFDDLPQLQRNLIATLSARLARASRLAADRRPGRVVRLERTGGPDLLGYALAASIAWHTRGSTLCVLVGVPTPAAFGSRQPVEPTPPFRRVSGEGAALMLAEPADAFAPERIERTLDELALVYDNVLVEFPSEWARVPPTDRSVRIGTSEAHEGAVAVRSRSGDGERVVAVSALDARELDSLRRGILSTQGTAGEALGSIARDLTNLRVGIALGAGSIRGYAHVGALRAVKRHGLPVDCLAGTSIGAAVATAYAHFADVDRVADFLDELGARMFRPRVSRKSLLSTHAMRRYVRKTFGEPRLEDLPIPVALVATDVETQDEVVLRRGSLATAVLASAAVPGVFPAVRIGQRTLVDGGVVNPVPVSAAVSLGADVVLGVRLVNPIGGLADEISEEGEGPIPSAVSAIMRSIELVQTRINGVGPSVPTILVTPDLSGVPAGKLRNFRDGRRYIDAGDAAVDEALPRLSSALPWLRPPPAEAEVAAAAPAAS